MITHYQNGFELKIDNRTYLRHTTDHPAFFIGEKDLSMRMEHGAFDIVDHTVFKPATLIKIDGDNLVFDAFSIQLTNQNETVELTFKDLNQPLSIQWHAEKEERIFGMGEHFTSLDLRGKLVKNWIEEHITRKQIYNKILRKLVGLKPKKWPFESYKTYFVMPVFVSSLHYFVSVDTTGYGIFDFTKPDVHKTSLYGRINRIIIGKSDSYLKTSALLTNYVGKTPRLPKWIYDGMIFAIQGGTQVIDEKLKKLNGAGVKVCGIWSQDWCGELYTFFGKQVFWNWEADVKLYPDLQDVIARWKDQGIKFLTYINPYLNEHGDMFASAKENDYLVKTSAGEPFLTKATSFAFGIVDLTNPKAYSWFKEIIKNNYLKLGIMGWMADFGEYLPTDCILHEGDGETFHNHWPDLWIKLNREVLEESQMIGKAVFFNRAGYKDNIKYTTLIWNGDQHVDFTDDFGMASAIRASLSLALSGVGVSHSDIGGYTTVPGIKRSKEVYLRWLETNAFTPIMRSHEGNKPWVNQQFDSDEEILNLTARMTCIHAQLKPYFLALEEEYQTKGYPIIRPRFLHDQIYSESDFMIGSDLIVFPVMKKHAKRKKIILSDGQWVHMMTGKIYQEGTHVVEAPVGKPAVFYRLNSSYTSIFEKVKDI